MGKHFGDLYKLRGIITVVISPFEQRAYANAISKGIPNIFRRTTSEIFYVVPPLALGYLIYATATAKHASLMRKNPKDYENDV